MRVLLRLMLALPFEQVRLKVPVFAPRVPPVRARTWTVQVPLPPGRSVLPQVFVPENSKSVEFKVGVEQEEASVWPEFVSVKV